MGKPKEQTEFTAADQVPVEASDRPEAPPAVAPSLEESPITAAEDPRILPNLAGVATVELVEQTGGSSFSAKYINWSRTVQLLRVHAPDWMPELVAAPDGTPIHRASIGGYLLIRFRNLANGLTTAAWPQAIMDAKNNSVPYEKISARDVTDTHRRGICMAAAGTFGLAYELWAKVDLESGYTKEAEDKPAAAEKPDYPKLLTGIETAADAGVLRSAFALAWRSFEGDPEMQADFKAAYDKRNAELTS